MSFKPTLKETDLESIKQALVKAKVTLRNERSVSSPQPSSPQPVTVAAWMPARVQLDFKHLEKHRLISFEMKDPRHVAFNILRTKIHRELKTKNWKTVAVTSPTPGCGKTMVAVNLAVSLARQPECKIVLVDLDLQHPSIARALGIVTDGSLGQYLEGESELEPCFVQVTDNLIVGCSNHPTKYSSELMLHQRLIQMLVKLKESIKPDIVLFDLPPLLSGDEAIAFLPQVDCTILVAASRLTTATEIEQCELQAGDAPFLGVVLNKCRAPITNYHYGA